MWIFTKYGFYSVSSVVDDDVVLRARMREHLEQLQERFKGTPIADAQIKVTPRSDYRFRIVMPKLEWAAIMSELVLEQDWSNFKNEAQKFEKDNNLSWSYVDALHEIWQVMYNVQNAEMKGKKWITKKQKSQQAKLPMTENTGS